MKEDWDGTVALDGSIHQLRGVGMSCCYLTLVPVGLQKVIDTT